MVKTKRRSSRGGSNMYSLAPADASGLQTTGASNYSAAPNDAVASVAPSIKGGRARGRARGRGRTRSQSQMKSKGRNRGIGGYWSAVLEQAVVPLTLLGIQQTYGRKRHLKQRTFKRRRH